MSKLVINVSFPPKEAELYHRIVKSCPKEVTLAEHARNILSHGLDGMVYVNRHSKAYREAAKKVSRIIKGGKLRKSVAK